MEYISSASQDALSRRYRSTAVVTLAFGLAVGIYLFIGRLIGAEASDLSPVYRRAIYYSAVALGVLAVVLRRFYLSPASLARVARQGRSGVLDRFSNTSIIVGAIGEAVAIVGLFGYFMTGDWDYLWRLGVIGLLLIAYAFPRRGEWARAVAASEAGTGAAGSGN